MSDRRMNNLRFADQTAALDIRSKISKKNTLSELFVPVLVVLSWIILLVWSKSSYSDFLNHGDWAKAGMLNAICTVDLSIGWFNSIALFTSAWILMVIAMMIPADLPFFQTNLQKHSMRVFDQTLRLMGYLLPWIGFGIITHGLGYIWQEIANVSIFLSLNGWIIAAIMFAAAGAYQFTNTKELILKRCCSSSVMELHAKSPNRKASPFIKGLFVSWNCVLLCGPIMMLMFVFWPGSLVWMFVLMLIMLADRVSVLSVRLHQPIGIALLSTSIGIATINMI